MDVWTTKRGTSRKRPDKYAGEVRVGNLPVKCTLLAACKAGLLLITLQDGYRASTSTLLGANASALIVGEV